MTLYHCFDAAYPPKSPPRSCGAVLGYIGGSRALHVWDHAEWLTVQHLRQYPCWVPDPHGKSTPAQIGAAAVDRANELGWRSSDGSRVIVIDLETFASPTWWHECATAINRGGYYAVCYGSASTVGGNKASNVWAAHYDDSQSLEGQHAHQYAANVRVGNTEVDYSVLDEWLWARGGIGPRH